MDYEILEKYVYLEEEFILFREYEYCNEIC